MSDLLKSLAARADQQPTGIFVGIRVKSLSPELKTLLDTVTKGCSGERVEEKHVTVIYSSCSYVPPEQLQTVIDLTPTPITAKACDVASFDALPKNGVRDGNFATLVLKLEAPELLQVHAALKELGCTHSYPELSPHLSLYYGVERSECKQLEELLQQAIASNEFTVDLEEFYIEPLKP